MNEIEREKEELATYGDAIDLEINGWILSLPYCDERVWAGLGYRLDGRGLGYRVDVSTLLGWESIDDGGVADLPAAAQAIEKYRIEMRREQGIDV